MHVRRPKLFHTLVAMGVTLTGGSLTTLACTGGPATGGGTTTENPPCEPGRDPGCPYPNISPAACDNSGTGTSCYPSINAGPPPDASSDHYANIAPCSNCGGPADASHYANISPPPLPDGG